MTARPHSQMAARPRRPTQSMVRAGGGEMLMFADPQTGPSLCALDPPILIHPQFGRIYNNNPAPSRENSAQLGLKVAAPPRIP
jgi:hypothetical protein